VLVKLSSSSASSVSSEASYDDLPKRKLPAIGSSSEEKESTFSSEENSSPQDASSSSSSSSAPKRSARSSPLVRDLSSSDWKWKSHSSTSQCGRARTS
jgi:hypothetical protein